jgi:predicted ATPase
VIRQLDLRHFKCFERLKLPLRPLTVLSGTNAAGKSTVVQPLVLLHQTMLDHEWSRRLALNGRAARLGTVSDVVDRVHGRGGFDVEMEHSEGTRIVWRFGGERSDMSMHIDRVVVDWEEGGLHADGGDLGVRFRYLLPDGDIPAGARQLTDQLRSLIYLGAERIGPRDTYPLRDTALTGEVGPTGERIPGFLYAGADERVLPDLALQGIPGTRRRQVEGHMRRFFPGCRVEVEKVPGASAVMLRLGTSAATELHTPHHTGFGLTQVLAIVVVALSLAEGGLLIVENPEVHLHPGGQALMGGFLSQVAAAGVQVIIETHSDHVLNGVRRAVKTDLLSSEAVSLHFFRPRGTDGREGAAQVESPVMDEDGRLDSWPDGFFDQFEKDSSFFAGWA